MLEDEEECAGLKEFRVKCCCCCCCRRREEGIRTCGAFWRVNRIESCEKMCPNVSHLSHFVCDIVGICRFCFGYSDDMA